MSSFKTPLGLPWNRVAEERALNKRILRDNIDRDSVGRRLTPEAKERAAEFAVDNWPANTGNGEAAKIGIKHVTDGVLKN